MGDLPFPLLLQWFTFHISLETVLVISSVVDDSLVAVSVVQSVVARDGSVLGFFVLLLDVAS
jgi:hypothetical protein